MVARGPRTRCWRGTASPCGVALGRPGDVRRSVREEPLVLGAVVEGEKIKRQEDDNQHTGQDQEGRPPAHAQDYVLHPDGVREAQPATHLPDAHDQAALVDEPVHEGGSEDGPPGQRVTEGHEETEENIEVPEFPRPGAPRGGRAQNGDPQGHQNPGSPPVRQDPRHGRQKPVRANIQRHHDGNVTAAPAELLQNRSEEHGEGMTGPIDQDHAEDAHPDDLPSVKEDRLWTPMLVSRFHFALLSLLAVAHTRGGVSGAPESAVKEKDESRDRNRPSDARPCTRALLITRAHI